MGQACLPSTQRAAPRERPRLYNKLLRERDDGKEEDVTRWRLTDGSQGRLMEGGRKEGGGVACVLALDLRGVGSIKSHKDVFSLSSGGVQADVLIILGLICRTQSSSFTFTSNLWCSATPANIFI